MQVRQEALTAKMSLKDLPPSSPLSNANLVLIFGSVRRFNDAKLPAQLKARYPSAQIVGCTTSGEIGPDGVSDDSLQITAITWDKSTQRVTYARANNMQTSAETAINLAKQLKADNLRTVLLFSDGLHIMAPNCYKVSRAYWATSQLSAAWQATMRNSPEHCNFSTTA